ncbi:MAG TPA: glycosyltransferase, partial [Ignavibacteria bacterium]|nr:glycosyltransferase [Ignavibacteria bacterium]
MFLRLSLKYSIIIPTLNEEKLLPNLLKQLNDDKLRNLYDIEIIISDGGSIDSTIETALKFSEIVKVHNLKKKQNIAEGRNIGAKLASGGIFIFLNGDILLPNVHTFFDYIDKNFTNNLKYDAMTCKVKVFPNEEKTVDKVFHFAFNFYFKLLNVLGMGMGRGECQIVRKNVFNMVQGYNETLAAGEDYDLFKRIKKIRDILFTNKICVYESPRRYR